MRRLEKSLVDYVTIAISPALIMALVASLLFFLIDVLYTSEFDSRLRWIMFWFAIGSVSITRLSLEGMGDKAGMYSIAFGLVVSLAVLRFLKLPAGSWLAPVGPLVMLCLMGFIWWCAHKLTWDSTLIDEEADASGEGLLDIAGIRDDDGEAARVEADSLTTERDQRLRRESLAARRKKPVAVDDDQAQDTGGRHVPLWQRLLFNKSEREGRPHTPGMWVLYFLIAAIPIFGLGQLVSHAGDDGHRRYIFNLICVYVGCCVALLLTTSFLGLRRYLRQRKLEMEPAMAAAWLITGAALIGGLMLLAMLIPRPRAEYMIADLSATFVSDNRSASRFAPMKSDAVTDANQRAARSSDSDAGEAGHGEGGKARSAADDTRNPSTGDTKANAATTTEAGNQASGAASSSGQGAGANAGASNANAQSGGTNAQSGGSQPSGSGGSQAGGASGSQGASPSQGSSSDGSGGQSQGNSPSSPSTSQSSSQSSSAGAAGQSAANQGAGSQGSGASQGSQSSSAGADASQGSGQSDSNAANGSSPSGESGQGPAAAQETSSGPSQVAQGARSLEERGASGAAESQPSSRETPPASMPRAAERASPPAARSPSESLASKLGTAIQWFTGGVMTLVKWAFQLAIIAALVYALWRNRESLSRGFAQLRRDLAEFFKRLFGPPARVEEELAAAAVGPKYKPFAAFDNPFLNGKAARGRQDDLARYTFDALQAWAHEHGAGRAPERTPLEFAGELAEKEPEMAQAAQHVAQLYCRVQYANGTVDATGVDALRRAWTKMVELHHAAPAA